MEGKACIFCRKFVYLQRRNIDSDAAVSNWAGDLGHPRRRFTRGVRQNVSAPFLLKVASQGGDFYRSYSFRNVAMNWRLIAMFLLIEMCLRPLNTRTSRASGEVWKYI